MKRSALVFREPFAVEIEEEETPAPGAGEALVQTEYSALSSGTEGLVYAGLFPKDMELDSSIASLRSAFSYPLRYGYAAVGRVVDIGEGVGRQWTGQRVFSFQPHMSAFTARVSDLIPLPEGLDPAEGAMLPAMETAVSLVQDGAPLLGERVLVVGQGVIGLLTAGLLARMAPAALCTLDRFPLRRRASEELGAAASLDPMDAGLEAALSAWLPPDGADLAFELSGVPQGLNTAVHWTGFSGRIVVGSWYGAKPGHIDLGGRFHRSRIRLLSSQVSSLDPQLAGRWDKPRRLSLALDWLTRLAPARLITHTFTLQRAAEAFELMYSRPEETLQIVLRHEA
jgi:2-desacetyl-2-hydroxyethyl bacteriochlorophyllide A dehydrogenase